MDILAQREKEVKYLEIELLQCLNLKKQQTATVANQKREKNQNSSTQ